VAIAAVALDGVLTELSWLGGDALSNLPRTRLCRHWARRRGSPRWPPRASGCRRPVIN